MNLMVWPTLVQVSFAEYTLLYRALLQKRHTVWKSLQIEESDGVTSTCPLLWAVFVGGEESEHERERASEIEKERVKEVVCTILFRSRERARERVCVWEPERERGGGGGEGGNRERKRESVCLCVCVCTCDSSRGMWVNILMPVKCEYIFMPVKT